MIGVAGYVALVLLWTSACTASLHHSRLTGKQHDDDADEVPQEAH